MYVDMMINVLELSLFLLFVMSMHLFFIILGCDVLLIGTLFHAI